MRALKIWGVLAVLALVLGGCGNPDVEEGDRFLVLDWNADQRQYEVVESTIETLDDVEAVDGEVAYLRGGGDIIAGTSEPQTEADYKEALLIEGDETPQARYEREDGAVKGLDFHSFLMFTLYHHLEKSVDYFQSIGVGEDTVGRIPVYYSPTLSFIIPVNLLTDNAAYAFTLDAFLIPPQVLLEEIPLAANRGVIVHEYSHAVVNRLVHEDARAPAYLLDDWPDAAANRMAALDEGVADIFGALATGEPNFIGPSISEELFDIDRDLSKQRVYDEALLDEVDTTPQSSFNPYALGTVVASTVWALRDDVDDDEALGRAVADTLRDLSGPEPTFRMADFFNKLWDNLPSHVQDAACDIFTDRLAAISQELQCAQ
ncbi:MAG: hypothetical protein ACLFVJ_22580 [Persicimonas sp.]